MKLSVRRVVLVSLLIAVFAVTLASCGGNERDPAPVESEDLYTPAPAAEEPVNEPPPEPAADFSGTVQIADKNGYTYEINYAFNNPMVTVDTTQGDPGYLRIIITPGDFSATVTNTTPGKMAPDIGLSWIPLYQLDGLDAAVPLQYDYYDLSLKELCSTTLSELVFMYTGNNPENPWLNGKQTMRQNQSVDARFSYTDNQSPYSFDSPKDKAQHIADMLSNPNYWVLTTVSPYMNVIGPNKHNSYFFEPPEFGQSIIINRGGDPLKDSIGEALWQVEIKEHTS
jgi:hypothetical protein